MSGHVFDVSRLLGWEPLLLTFVSRLARCVIFQGFAGEYSRLSVEASLASCNRVESSSMMHFFPLQGWNGYLNQSGFISNRPPRPTITIPLTNFSQRPARSCNFLRLSVTTAIVTMRLSSKM